MSRRRRLVSLAAAVATCAAMTTVSLSGPAGATPRGGYLRLAGSAAPFTSHTRATGDVAATTRLTVQVERRKGFKGRIPLEVRGLPHGVRVLDVGLNGILITEQQTARTVVIYCEPWVVPTEHPFVVLARHEGSNRDFAARSVLLRIAGK